MVGDFVFAMNLQEGMALYLILLASLSIHEWAHAFVADKLGDPVPRAQGRVTLNPVAHIDPVGTVFLPLLMIFLNPGFAIFGWGKPVQVSLPNPKTRARDDMLITAAGPLANLVIALLVAGFAGLLFWVMPDAILSVSLLKVIILLNCLLFLFNLIPVPPLDGSHFLKHAIGMRDQTYAEFARYGFVLILVLINLPAFSSLFFGVLLPHLAFFFFSLAGI
ncbi:MAG: site-2 protease family protein [Opitutae bacterium]|nr:site-2 protease family protein [Opitutae bacterium]